MKSCEVPWNPVMLSEAWNVQFPVESAFFFLGCRVWPELFLFFPFCIWMNCCLYFFVFVPLFAGCSEAPGPVFIVWSSQALIQHVWCVSSCSLPLWCAWYFTDGEFVWLFGVVLGLLGALCSDVRPERCGVVRWHCCCTGFEGHEAFSGTMNSYPTEIRCQQILEDFLVFSIFYFYLIFIVKLHWC